MEDDLPRPDTIVALSTSPGVGAVAVVRLSGAGARDVLAAVAPNLPHPLEPRRPSLARIVDPREERAVDRALVTVFPGPTSYTGEDVVEISGHGGWLAPRLVVEACIAAGAREAEPGEFTRRAYLNGKLDLVQAEAVGDLVEGRSLALHRAALDQLDEGLSRRVSGIRRRLVHLEALLVHHIDFPEEDEPPVSVEEVAREADRLEADLDRLLATAAEGELLREGALTVLAGRPNAGKSSLFNALLGRERAIVTEVPGTTRDALEAVVSLGGFPFRLVDTAGLRDSGERVEVVGIEVARRYLAAADLVLFCAEAGRPLADDERRFLGEVRAPVVLVRTRSDEAGERAQRDPRGADVHGPVPVSVVTGEGLERLRTLLPELVYEGLVASRGDAPVLTRRRQRRGIEEARGEVAAFARALRSGVPVEVASAHLKPAETALEEVLGVITSDDVLDHLFATFCIGK